MNLRQKIALTLLLTVVLGSTALGQVVDIPDPNLDGEMYLRMKPENPADVNGDGAVNILDLCW